MGNKITGIAGIAVGVIILLIWACSAVRRAKQGRMMLDGKVTEVDSDRRTVGIRYRTGRDTYHESSYPAASAFLSGRIPPVGLKVSVIVHKDDVYRPLSVLMIPANSRVSKKPYFNSSNMINAARILVLSLSLIICGMIALWG